MNSEEMHYSALLFDGTLLSLLELNKVSQKKVSPVFEARVNRLLYKSMLENVKLPRAHKN